MVYRLFLYKRKARRKPIAKNTTSQVWVVLVVRGGMGESPLFLPSPRPSDITKKKAHRRRFAGK